MKVLFSHAVPFFFSHGGVQTLTEALMRGVGGLGVEVEPVRWWDDKQTGEIIHYICRPNPGAIRLAHAKNFKVVMTDLLDQTASRSRPRLFLQRTAIQTIRAMAPGLAGDFRWSIYQEADALAFAVGHEWDVARYLFGADPARGHIIPHGLEDEALKQLAAPAEEQDYLVSVAAIDSRKNSVLLAESARQARVPVVFLGKPYAQDSAYFARFKELIDDKYVRYPGYVTEQEKYRYLRGARGFALLSRFESGCIAVYEAAAAGLPLFLPDLPWASRSYPQAIALRLVRLRDADAIASDLEQFYQGAHRMQKNTFPVLSWRDVARQYVKIYENILAR